MINKIQRITDYTTLNSLSGAEKVLAYAMTKKWNADYAYVPQVKSVDIETYTYTYQTVDITPHVDYDLTTDTYAYYDTYIYTIYNLSYNIPTYTYYEYPTYTYYENAGKIPTGKTYTYYTNGVKCIGTYMTDNLIEHIAYTYYYSYSIIPNVSPEIVSYSYTNITSDNYSTYYNIFETSYEAYPELTSYISQKDNVNIPLSLINYGKIINSSQSKDENNLNHFNFKYNSNKIISDAIKVYDGKQGDKGRKGYQGAKGETGIDAITYAIANEGFTLDENKYTYLYIVNSEDSGLTDEQLTYAMYSAVSAKKVNDTVNNLNEKVLKTTQYEELDEKEQDVKYFTFEEVGNLTSNRTYSLKYHYVSNKSNDTEDTSTTEAPTTEAPTTEAPAPTVSEINAGDVVFNEIDAANKQMEFYNTTSNNIELSSLVLKGVDEEGTERTPWTFPSDAVIKAKSYYVIVFKSSDESKGPAYGLSGSKRWEFTLVSNDVEIDTVNNFDGDDKAINLTSGSYGRVTDGADEWQVFEVNTIGTANAVVETPEEEETIAKTKLTEKEVYTTPVAELSGITFDADKSSLVGVSDTGSIYNINYSTGESNLLSQGNSEDIEGITIDSTGNLYYVNEANNTIMKIAKTDTGYDYANPVKVSDDSHGLNSTEIKKDPTAKGQDGFEGIAWISNDEFYLAQQRNYEMIVRYSLSKGIISKQETSFATEIADINYDAEDNLLYALCSDDACIYVLDPEKSFEVVKAYELPIDAQAENPEALCIDKANKIFYLGCDKTSNLYAVKFDESDTEIEIPEVVSLNAGDVVFNEIQPANKKMEFYNTTSTAINLSNVVLKGKDEEDADRTDWTFPENTVIAAKGYYTITFKSSNTADGPTYGLSGTKKWVFTLVDGETILDTVTNTIDGTTIDLSSGSYGRKTDGASEWTTFSTATIGETNK